MSRPRLLIVEDNRNIRMMIRLALRETFDLREADDADVAQSMIAQDRPDIVVLDVMMPGSINGFQLCERIKRDPALAGIHVVLVTARGQVSDQELGLALGADAYFIKPFSPVALAEHLRGAMRAPQGCAATTTDPAASAR